MEFWLFLELSLKFFSLNDPPPVWGVVNLFSKRFISLFISLFKLRCLWLLNEIVIMLLSFVLKSDSLFILLFISLMNVLLKIFDKEG